MAFTAERAKTVNLSDGAYYQVSEFAQLKDSNIRSIEDLKGKTVGTIQGLSFAKTLSGRESQLDDLTFLRHLLRLLPFLAAATASSVSKRLNLRQPLTVCERTAPAPAPPARSARLALAVQSVDQNCP